MTTKSRMIEKKTKMNGAIFFLQGVVTPPQHPSKRYVQSNLKYKFLIEITFLSLGMIKGVIV